jgi:preprotein translocase subunit YajC
MSDLGIVIAIVVFWFLFWGPHTKSAEKKDDKKGGKGK